jgi:hypothetical protein
VAIEKSYQIGGKNFSLKVRIWTRVRVHQSEFTNPKYESPAMWIRIQDLEMFLKEIGPSFEELYALSVGLVWMLGYLKTIVPGNLFSIYWLLEIFSS